MNPYDAGEIRAMLSKSGFTFSKSMGQNFLIDENVPRKIADEAGIDSSCGVLEVGPGIGSLTVRLAERAGRVVAVELDRRLLPILRKTLEDRGSVEVVQGDILKLDIAELVSERFHGLKPAVCANLPYNITTPLIARLVDAGIFGTMTLMVQREVALRICAAPGSADYGAFSVYMAYHTVPEILFDVPPEAFMPRPKVTSAVIRLTRRDAPACEIRDRELFFRVVRAAFAQRRKTLVNALAASFGDRLSKAGIGEIIRSCGFDEKIRGETLGVPAFAAIADQMRERL